MEELKNKPFSESLKVRISLAQEEKNRALVLKEIIICDFRRGRIVCARCGPSMMDYPGSSGNLQKMAADISGFFYQKKKIEKNNILHHEKKYTKLK